MSYLEKLFGLHGQTVVITGASPQGIGAALVSAMAQAGAERIIITRTTEDGVAETVTRLRNELSAIAVTTQIDGLAFHSENEASVATFAARLRSLGVDKVHTLVNCIGGNVKEATLSPNPIDGRLRFQDLKVSEIERTLRQNVVASVIIQQAVIDLLFAAGKASIIEIGSMAAIGGGLTRVGAYGAAKAALETFAKWLAVELAKNEDHYGEAQVRVNVIAPGFFVGEQNRNLLYKNPEAGELSERGLLICENTPMGRFGDVSELLATAILLASPNASSFTTGTTVFVDGGFSAFNGV